MPPKKSKSIHEIADALGQGMPFSPATAEVAGAVGFDTEHENQVDRLDGAAPFDDYDYTEQEWGGHQNYRWPHDPGSVSLADLVRAARAMAVTLRGARARAQASSSASIVG